MKEFFSPTMEKALTFLTFAILDIIFLIEWPLLMISGIPVAYAVACLVSHIIEKNIRIFGVKGVSK